MAIKQSRLGLKDKKGGVEEDKITWFSNSKRCSEYCTVGLADVKLHGAQTPDVAGTIFEGKWNCMMLKLAFEPEHALEVEETFGCRTFTYFTI